MSDKISFIQNLKSMFSWWFSYQDIDDHYVLKFFGLKFCKKHSYNFELKEVNELGVTKEKRNPKLIVSLTTFPERINTVYKTISTILQQSVKPDEVILWLADEQFPNKELPENLTRLQQFGLSIKWCENIMSFKKLVPSLREFPEDILITAYDDIFYPTNYVESLYGEYLKNPQIIHANRAFVIKEKNNILSINARSYIYNKTYCESFLNEFMTGYGTLFPPHTLHEDVLKSDIFMKLMPTNDDVWFWANAVKKGTKISVNPNSYSLKLMIDRTIGGTCLWKMNMKNTTIGINGNDAVNLMRDKYEEIRINLKKEL